MVLIWSHCYFLKLIDGYLFLLTVMSSVIWFAFPHSPICRFFHFWFTSCFFQLALFYFHFFIFYISYCDQLFLFLLSTLENWVFAHQLHRSGIWLVTGSFNSGFLTLISFGCVMDYYQEYLHGSCDFVLWANWIQLNWWFFTAEE